MKSKASFNQIALYSAVTFLTGIILIVAIHPNSFVMRIPLVYSGDSLFVATIIKSIMDSHHYVTNPFLGAPFIYNIADYPIYTIFNYAIVRFFTLFTQNYAVVLNSYYFATYFFVAWLALFVYQRLGLSKWYAVIASVLFTFVPYHWMRGETHFWINIFLATPIYVLLAFDIYEDQEQSYFSRKWGYLLLCLLAAASSSAGYFAFFGCYILLVAGFVASLDKKMWQPFLRALLYVGLTGAMIGINLTPDIIQNYKFGHNTESADRVAFDSEISGLKIMQLVLPIDDHHVPVLNVLKQKYNKTAPLVNENATASLGIIGSIGLFILMIVLIVRRFAVTYPTLYTMSFLNLMAILLGTIGGFGSIFAYAISPVIRSYNRISVYIAFFCLFGFFYVLEKWLAKKSIDAKKISYWLIGIFLLIVGVYDQLPRHSAFANLPLQATYVSDEAFVKQIETIMPPMSAIFELPYASFPESLRINQMAEDELLRPYLHSHQLRWSYGAMRGRTLTKWQETVSKEAVPEMLKQLALTGFTGVYLDRSGYLDQGKQIESALSETLKVKPLVSQDGSMVFFDMRNYVKHFYSDMPQSEVSQQTATIYFKMNSSYKWQRGFYDLLMGEQGTVQWSNSQGELLIENMQPHPVLVHLSVTMAARREQPVPLQISGNLLHEVMNITQSGIVLNRNVMLQPGSNTIDFKALAVKKDISKNKTNWYFKVSNFMIQPIG